MYLSINPTVVKSHLQTSNKKQLSEHMQLIQELLMKDTVSFSANERSCLKKLFCFCQSEYKKRKK